MNNITGKFFSQASFAKGELVPLKTQNPRHFADFNIEEGQIEKNMVGKTGGEFYSKFVGALNSVNQTVITSDKLSEQLITKPNTVNVHDVTIAAQKAQVALDLTKNVLQRAVTSYQSIINLR